MQSQGELRGCPLPMQDACVSVLPANLLLDERAAGAAQSHGQWKAAPSDHRHASASGSAFAAQSHCILHILIAKPQRSSCHASACAQEILCCAWAMHEAARCVQGCGKTTIVEVLEAVFKHDGMRPASISIDDFYLRFEDQQALAQVGSRQLAQTSSVRAGRLCSRP